MKELKTALAQAAKDLFDTDVEPELTRPEEKFGDYATNLALQLGRQLGRNPKEVAVVLAGKLHGGAGLAKVEIAGPGFINLTLTDEYLAKSAFGQKIDKPLEGQEILVEFGDPNPFKEMHIGHLYSYIVGDAISSLLEVFGAEVKRLSYHGDVGLHVAKAIYGQLELGEGADLGASYAYGAEKYASYPTARERIEAINQAIYSGNDPEINELHKAGTELSFANFDKVLALLNIKTDKRYLESQTTGPGKKLVEENIGTVFTQSQGAIIFDGEKAGLHTRVFITSKGLPTYETKDLGLVKLKDKDYPQAGRSIVITANEQSEYFKVMLAALAQIDKDLSEKTEHVAHGFLSLSTGKMSSRTGDVYSAMELLLKIKDTVHEQYPDSPVKKPATLAAAKYALLKHRLGSNLVIDVKESVSLEGNSGPYLQYAHARASSILAKAKEGKAGLGKINFDENERKLARKISEYPEVMQKAASELMPHYVCTYLYELAQTFNSFYETSRIIGDEREVIRSALVKSYRHTLKAGLNILNIEAPERM